MSDHTYQPAGDGHHGPHVTPPWLLLAVFFALITLTGLTVVCADPTLKEKLRLYLNRQFFPMTPQAMSRLSLWVALIIATVKATLVALYFMHLRWDKPMNGIVAVSAFLFVALFIGFSMADSVWVREETQRSRVYNDVRQSDRIGRQPGHLAPLHEEGADHGDAAGGEGQGDGSAGEGDAGHSGADGDGSGGDGE